MQQRAPAFLLVGEAEVRARVVQRLEEPADDWGCLDPLPLGQDDGHGGRHPPCVLVVQHGLALRGHVLEVLADALGQPLEQGQVRALQQRRMEHGDAAEAWVGGVRRGNECQLLLKILTMPQQEL